MTARLYKIRLNPRAINQLTMKVNPRVMWEVEQSMWQGGDGRTDSERVIWHCAEVRIDGTSISKLFRLTKPGEPKWELEFYGMALRGQDDAIEIHTGEQDGN